MYYTAEVDKDKCTGCRLCVMGCPDPNVIALCTKDKTVVIDRSRCKGCGVCESVCTKEALRIRSVTLLT